ncbi:SMI1/KNR4 family protein [Actinoplanes sp. CA-252034]|uniref:SMI1/KNR4 family protein n=1 Tax=Actinoplanes sp. CA-252034 TaxID=3239906 RepID=UPI003D9933DD
MLGDDDLARLEAAWRSQGSPIADELAPGLTDARRAELEAETGLVLPGELRRWWGWHDGVREGCWVSESRIGAGAWLFLSLEEAIEAWRERVEWSGSFPENRENWNGEWAPWWFPVVSGHTAFLFADLSSATDDAVPIHLWAQQPTGVFTPVVASFGEVVRGWAEGIERGFFVWSQEDEEWDIPFNVPPEIRKLT